MCTITRVYGLKRIYESATARLSGCAIFLKCKSRRNFKSFCGFCPVFVNDSIADGQLQRSVEKTETVAVLRYLIVATAFAVVAVEKHYGKGYHKSGSQRQIVVVIQPLRTAVTDTQVLR